MWGLSFVAQSEGASIGTFTFNGIRTLIGGIVLVPLVVISHMAENKKLPSAEKKKFPFKDVLIGGICCGIPLFLGGNDRRDSIWRLYGSLRDLFGVSGRGLRDLRLYGKENKRLYSKQR